MIVLSISAQDSLAGIVAISGDISLITSPSSAQLNQLTNEEQILGFFEQQGVVLSSNLSVSATAPGAYGASAGGTLFAGSTVSSYMFHADTLVDLSSGTQLQATVTLDELVLGIIFERGLLDASDGTLGLSTTSYAALTQDSGFRELEFGGLMQCGISTVDCVTISADRRSVSFNFSVGPYIDEVRIVTATSVPEPSSLLLSAVALLAIWRRRSTDAGLALCL